MESTQGQNSKQLASNLSPITTTTTTRDCVADPFGIRSIVNFPQDAAVTDLITTDNCVAVACAARALAAESIAQYSVQYAVTLLNSEGAGAAAIRFFKQLYAVGIEKANFIPALISLMVRRVATTLAAASGTLRHEEGVLLRLPCEWFIDVLSTAQSSQQCIIQSATAEYCAQHMRLANELFGLACEYILHHQYILDRECVIDILTAVDLHYLSLYHLRLAAALLPAERLPDELRGTLMPVWHRALEAPVFDLPLSETTRTVGGVLYILGTGGRRWAWRNPANDPALVQISYSTREECRVLRVGRSSRALPTSDLMVRDGILSHTANKRSSWICVEFAGGAVAPTHYTLRAHALYGISSWQLEGRRWGKGKDEWKVLARHRNEHIRPGEERTWKLLNQNGEFYKCFRIVQKGKNLNKTFNFGVDGLELFGKLACCTVKYCSLLQ